MKFPIATLIAASLLTPSLMQTAHADPVTVQTRPAPALADGVWANGSPTTMAAQRGKVVVLLFWTHYCINCKHNLGYWNEWAKKYRNTDVAVISVHTPETHEERAPSGVRRFSQAHGLLFPVVTDNASQTWNAYGISSWPTEVLIDKQGRIRAQYEGELNWQGSGEYKTVEREIEKLRAER